MNDKTDRKLEEIDVRGYDAIVDSVEVARLWVEHKGRATCFIAPDRLVDPEMFGMLMVDAIRHGARAFSQRLGIAEEECLVRIWSGLNAERNDPTDGITTIQDFEPGER